MPEHPKKNEILRAAYEYVRNGEWDKVITEYVKVLAMDPEDAQALNILGDAYVNKKKETEAFKAYHKSREIYSKQGNASRVAALDKKLAKLTPENLDEAGRRFQATLARSLEAERLTTEGNHGAAVAFHRQLAVEEPENISRRETLAKSLLETGDTAEWLKEMRVLAQLYLSQGHLDQARDCMKKILQADPDDMETIRLLVSLSRVRGDLEQVLVHSGRLAQLALDRGRLDEAKDAAEEAVRGGHDGIKPLYAKILLALKKPAEAKSQLEAMLAVSPDDVELLEQLLAVEEELKDWNKAYARVDILLKHRPEDNGLLERAALILLKLDKKPEAFQVYGILAVRALKDKKVDAALGYFDRILAADPDHVDALNKKADFYMKLNKKKELIETYKRLQTAYTNKKLPEEAKKIGAVITRLSGMKG